eukprot:400325-Ditylum_brightwellii.AAC.1
MADTADTPKKQPCTRSPNMLDQTTTTILPCSRKSRKGRLQAHPQGHTGSRHRWCREATTQCTHKLIMELEDARDSALS